MINYNNVLAEQLSELESYIKLVSKSFKSAPKGSIQTSKSNGIYQYYLVDPETKERKYLSSYEKSTAAAIIHNDYNKKLLDKLNKMHHQLNKFLKNYDVDEISAIYNTLAPGKKKLIIPTIPTDEIIIENWLRNHIGSQNTFPSASTFTTDNGEIVKSKSEMLIANQLKRRGIPYVYEPAFITNSNGTKYPDFLILNVAKRKEVYWEHLGKVDDIEYSFKNMNKLEMYERNNLIIGDNLIVSMETKAHPLDLNIINKKIDLFLC